MAFPAPTAPTESLVSANATKVYFASATAPTEAEIVPVVGDISVQFSDSVENIPIYNDEGWDRAVHNGVSATIGITTMAPSGNAVVADLLATGRAASSARQGLVVVEFADGSYAYGAFIVGTPTPATPVRGTHAWQLNLTSDGPVDFAAAAPAV